MNSNLLNSNEPLAVKFYKILFSRESIRSNLLHCFCLKDLLWYEDSLAVDDHQQARAVLTAGIHKSLEFEVGSSNVGAHQCNHFSARWAFLELSKGHSSTFIATSNGETSPSVSHSWKMRTTSCVLIKLRRQEDNSEAQFCPECGYQRVVSKIWALKLVLFTDRLRYPLGLDLSTKTSLENGALYGFASVSSFDLKMSWLEIYSYS